MSSASFAVFGRGELLPVLRGDLKRSRESLLVVCPWIDAFFAQELGLACPPGLTVRVLVRPESGVDPPMWTHVQAGLGILAARFPSLAVRGLERLHAKALIIDGKIGFLGSANFYRFSLEQSYELTLRGPLDEMGELAGELEALWQQAVPFSPHTAASSLQMAGMIEEALDPVARAILEQNPKAWVMGKRPKH